MRGHMRWSSLAHMHAAGSVAAPYSTLGTTQNAAASLDRSRTDPGLLHNGDPAVHAFTDHGWRWGG